MTHEAFDTLVNETLTLTLTRTVDEDLSLVDVTEETTVHTDR